MHKTGREMRVRVLGTLDAASASRVLGGPRSTWGYGKRNKYPRHCQEEVSEASLALGCNEVLLFLQHPATTATFNDIAPRAALYLGDEVTGFGIALGNAEFSRIIRIGHDFLRYALVATGDAHFNSTDLESSPFFFVA